jgi:hypothetical protein
VPKVLVKNRAQIHARPLAEVLHHVLGHDVLILEMLVEVMKQLPPAFVVVDNAPQRINKERALEILIYRGCQEFSGSA